MSFVQLPVILVSLFRNGTNTWNIVELFKRPHILKLVLQTFLVLSSALSCNADNDKVVFATGEWPPFTSENLPHYGHATALVSAICKVAGIDPVYEFYPWKRAEALVLKGKAFAAFPYALSADRQRSFDFSEVLFQGLNVLVYHQNNPNIPKDFIYKGTADLSGYRIGGISGSFLQSDLDQAGITYKATTSIDQSIQKLVVGRLDFCIDDRVVLTDAISRLYPEQIQNFKFVSQPFGEKKPTALLVSRSYPDAQELLKRFNNAIKTMRENGEYDRILEDLHLADDVN